MSLVHIASSLHTAGALFCTSDQLNNFLLNLLGNTKPWKNTTVQNTFVRCSQITIDFVEAIDSKLKLTFCVGCQDGRYFTGLSRTLLLT